MAIRRAMATRRRAGGFGNVCRSAQQQRPKPGHQEAQQAGTGGNRDSREAGRRRDGRPARADRHHDDARALLHEVAGAAHVRAVRADRDQRAARPTPRCTSASSTRPPMPDPKAKKVEYPWDDIHFVPAAQLAGERVKLQPRVHGDRRHLRRLHRVQGAPARKGAEERRAEDGRAEDAGHRARLLQRRAHDQHDPGRRQGQHADRARSAPTKRASVRSCSARRNCCPRRTWNSRRAKSCRSSSRSTTPASTRPASRT